MRNRDGKRQRRKAEEKGRIKKTQVRKKVARSRNIAFLQWFLAPKGQKYAP